MTLTYRSVKGSALTAAEFDGNTHDLDDRVTTLETSPTAPHEISGYTETSTTFTLTIDNGSTVGPIGKAIASIRWRGAWVAATAYLAGDIFTVTGTAADDGVYLVLVDHTSAGSFDPAAVDGSSTPLYKKQLAYGNPAYRIDIPFSGSGTLSASQDLLYHRFSKAVTLPADLAAYLAHASEFGGIANATADTVINIDKAVAATPTTFSTVGTVTIGIGTVNGAADTSATAVTFAAGDILRLQAPASPDSTFAGFFGSIIGFET